MTYQINNPEDKARHDLINPALEKSGWKVQHYSKQTNSENQP